jgi:hypothetical protein
MLIFVLMVDQMVDHLPFFVKQSGDQMVDFFFILCLKITGNYSRRIIDGLSGILIVLIKEF